MNNNNNNNPNSNSTILIFNLKLSTSQILNENILEFSEEAKEILNRMTSKIRYLNKNENILTKAIFNGITSLINDGKNNISIYDQSISIALDNNKHIIIPKEDHYSKLNFKFGKQLEDTNQIYYYLSDSINLNNQLNIKYRYYNDSDDIIDNKPIFIYEYPSSIIMMKLINQKYELRFNKIEKEEEDITYPLNWFYLDNKVHYELMIIPKQKNVNINDIKYNLILQKVIEILNKPNESFKIQFVSKLLAWKNEFSLLYSKDEERDVILKFNYNRDINRDIYLTPTNLFNKEELFISFTQKTQINDFTTLKVKDIIDIIKNVSFRTTELLDMGGGRGDRDILNNNYSKAIQYRNENLIFTLDRNKSIVKLPGNLVSFIKSTHLNNPISMAAMIYINRYEEHHVQFWDTFIVSIYAYFIYKLEILRKKGKKEGPYFITSFDFDLKRENELIDDWLEANHIIELDGILLRIQSFFSISQSILRFKFNLIINPLLLKLINSPNYDVNLNEGEIVNKLFV